MRKFKFSFKGGGALLLRLRKLKVLGPHKPSLKTRILVVVAITWLPLFVLTAWRGLAFGRSVQIPFLLDWIQYARFFIALPIALWAERYVSPKFESVLSRFVVARIISDQELPRFDKAVSQANALKDSAIAELLIFALAYLYLSLGLQRDLLPSLTSWSQPLSGGGSLLMIWYNWVSMPIFIFVWLRWVWRQGAWAYLLFKISRMRLRLVATHPDHAGGLAFVSVGQRRFAVLVFAISSLISASIAQEIIFGGAHLRAFEPELTAFFFVCVLVVMGPLLVFTPQMIQAKLRDWGTYGILAAAYTQQFDEKWIEKKGSSREDFLGNQDFQALADLKNSYEGISQMRVLLPDRQTVVVLLLAYALPIVPLLATVIPLRQILSELLKLLMK